MAAFIVNGQTVESGKNQKLLRFLRDELHLTSVKDGCSEGACGACTVIIDGRTCKACVPDTDSLEGKNVITVEGLTDWEEKVYTYAYGKAGAVQCGFCIPGMIMCTKALPDRNHQDIFRCQEPFLPHQFLPHGIQAPSFHPPVELRPPA